MYISDTDILRFDYFCSCTPASEGIFPNYFLLNSLWSEVLNKIIKWIENVSMQNLKEKYLQCKVWNMNEINWTGCKDIERHCIFLNWKNKHHFIFHTAESDSQWFNAVHTKISMVIFHKNLCGTKKRGEIIKINFSIKQSKSYYSVWIEKHNTLLQ